MWIWATIGSALLLGIYDLAKKQALKNNDVYYILFWGTLFSTLFLSPFLSKGAFIDHIYLIIKAILVSTSWISGLYGIKLLPITTAGTIKASRPVFVLIFSLILFGEKLNLWQWSGVTLTLVSLYMLSRSSIKEGIDFSHSKGVFYMAISVISGVCSALFDKHIMSYMEPLFVQSWCNLYIALIIGAIILFKRIREEEPVKFTWDWMLLLIAIFITGADFLYFYSLSRPGALLSVISLTRRSSVIITFIGGALIFKEMNIKSKAIDLGIMLLGMVLIVLGSQ